MGHPNGWYGLDVYSRLAVVFTVRPQEPPPWRRSFGGLAVCRFARNRKARATEGQLLHEQGQGRQRDTAASHRKKQNEKCSRPA